tara:strand:+ start:374 stop:847 length:474 start_codon:yes stop_codon:yes gene_type:complete
MKNKELLLKYAIYYLSKYSSSKKNLDFILKKKIRKISDDKRERFELYNEIELIIEKLEKKNFINDENYALRKIQYLLLQGKSKNFIKQYLAQKGLEKETINKQTELTYNVDVNIEKESAMKFVKKKNLLNKDISYEKKLAKIARAGFSYEIAKDLLK